MTNYNPDEPTPIESTDSILSLLQFKPEVEVLDGAFNDIFATRSLIDFCRVHNLTVSQKDIPTAWGFLPARVFKRRVERDDEL